MVDYKTATEDNANQGSKKILLRSSGTIYTIVLAHIFVQNYINTLIFT